MTEKLLAEWFWTDRWMGSSAFLLPMEPRGLYREMLTQSWRRGARLPNDHEMIQRAVGCTSEEWRRCWPKIARYWQVDGDCLVNPTQLEVYVQAAESKQRVHDRAIKAAESSARVRAQAEHKLSTSSAQAQAQAELVQSPPSPSPSPSLSLTPTPKKPEAPSGVVVPDWVPIDAWSDFLDARKKARSTMTRRAQELAIGALGRLRAAGDDPRAVIEQSILNGWKGLFPLRPNGAAPTNGASLHAGEKTVAASREAMRRAAEREEKIGQLAVGSLR